MLLYEVDCAQGTVLSVRQVHVECAWLIREICGHFLFWCITTILAYDERHSWYVYLWRVLKMMVVRTLDWNLGQCPLRGDNKHTTFRKSNLPPFSQRKWAIWKVSVAENKGDRPEPGMGKEGLGQTSPQGQQLWVETNCSKGRFDIVLSNDTEAGLVMLCRSR
jgi:hypothetical protein